MIPAHEILNQKQENLMEFENRHDNVKQMQIYENKLKVHGAIIK